MRFMQTQAILKFRFTKYMKQAKNIEFTIQDRYPSLYKNVQLICQIPVSQNLSIQKQTNKLISCLQPYNINHVLLESIRGSKEDNKIMKHCVKVLLKTLSERHRFVTRFYTGWRYHIGSSKDIVPLLNWKFLNSLDFSDSLLNTKGAISIASLKLQYLTQLLLNNNRIGPEGVSAIASRKFNYLTFIQLSVNPLTNKGVKQMCKADWPKLKYVSMMHVRATKSILRYIGKFKAHQQRMLRISINFQGNSYYAKTRMLQLSSLGIKIRQFYDLSEYLRNNGRIGKNVNIVAKHTRLQRLLQLCQRSIGVYDLSSMKYYLQIIAQQTDFLLD